MFGIKISRLTGSPGGSYEHRIEENPASNQHRREKGAGYRERGLSSSSQPAIYLLGLVSV